ncbi:hypothetical protein GGR57DRAFT_237633 [Xylariaceae sp. FL1272]|nr:hypothetical protein GGR57DRAFT_237633 [Xylariaceae sp. FL1272]
MRFPLILSLALLTPFTAAAPEPLILPHPTKTAGVAGALQTLLGNIGNFQPPALLWTPQPSPECAISKGGNGGQLQCCRAIVAGDQPIVVFLAEIYGYLLNPNDVNGLVCDQALETCPGVRACCQVTALNPLLSLYCADYNPSS